MLLHDRAAGCRFSVVALTLVSAACASGTAPATSPAPRIERIEQVTARTLERIWGPAPYGSVLDVDGGAPWMSDGVALPSVLRRDGRVWMYFAAVRRTDNPYLSRVQIGLAESADGLTFHVGNGRQPVLGPGAPGAFDSHSVSHPFVLEGTRPGERGSTRGREFWMYYAGADGTQGANAVHVERLGLARSEDGVRWRRETTPVIDVGGAGEVDSIQVASPFVVRRGAIFHMWYGAYDGAHRIAYATSADGTTWIKHGAVVGLRGATAGELGPSVYFDGRRYLMFYNSVDDQQWKLYAATSEDGLRWTAAYEGRPVVGDAPAGTFAVAGPGRNSAVHLSELVPVSGGLVAYYTGEDSASLLRIGILRLRGRGPRP